MHARDLITRGATYYSDKVAVIFGEQRLTFETVYGNANALANALLNLGLHKGDRVAFLLANSAQSIEIDFAILQAGLVRVPLNTRLSESEHLHMLAETETRAILFTEEFVNRVATLRPQLRTVQHYCQINGQPSFPWVSSLSALTAQAGRNEPPVVLHEDDYATIQYTSGTTGTLKAAIHTQETWAAIATNILTALRIEEDDVMLHAAPLTHASGTLVLPHWIRGGTNAILSGFQPEEYLAAVEHLHATTLNLVPTMIVMLINHPRVQDYSFDSVRSLIYGASPMPREALRRGLSLWGPKFIQYYGQTESPLILTLLDAKEHVGDTAEVHERLLSCGRPIPTTALRIVDEQGQPVSPGTIGEIAVASSQSMVGYWKAPKLTEATLRDGWIYTRDMGYIDERGYVFLVDRKSDMIISGGFNIYPREVEEVLYLHPAVLEAAVIGVPDEVWVEAIKAYVVLRPGQTTEQELIDFCRDHLASYKKPKSVEFLDSLPKNPTGKVVRRVLRDPHWQGRERGI
ncbi:MAG: AMP-binding protein [Chloroflexota bacterium]|nr:AMP-binding protein [Chloroflexota bacterium]